MFRFRFSGCNLQVCGELKCRRRYKTVVQVLFRNKTAKLILLFFNYSLYTVQLLLNDSLSQARNQDFAKGRKGGLESKLKMFLFKNVAIERSAEQVGATKAYRRLGSRRQSPELLGNFVIFREKNSHFNAIRITLCTVFKSFDRINRMLRFGSQIMN